MMAFILHHEQNPSRLQTHFILDKASVADPAQQCGAPNEVRRHFSRFSDAVGENGESRILVGYHFRIAVDEGLKQGRKIGATAVQNHLKAAP